MRDALTRLGLCLATLSRKRARVMMLVLAALVTLPALAADPLALPKAKGGTCIEAPAVMRRDHPDMLKHQRDETLRLGIRGAKASLKECIACHATTASDGRPVPVSDPGQFCQSCHAYAAVKPDCFECHAAIPAQKTAGGAP
jgi:predicted CXXCH cytochrome family protein